MPTDHEMGPWCPEHIDDGPEAGGLWMDGEQTFDLDGAFIENLATFYNDPNWLMYDEDTGEVIKVRTQEDCILGAGAGTASVFFVLVIE